MSNVRDIIATAVPDSTVKRVIDRFGFVGVEGKRFKYQQNIPAFSIGRTIMRWPHGTVYVSDWLIFYISPKELEWIILHELAHILYNDLPEKNFLRIMSIGGPALLGLVFKSFPVAVLSFLLSRPFVGRRTVGITAEQELRADWFASNKQGLKIYGINALRKLSRGHIDMFSHIAQGFMFEEPVLTFRQRIDSLRRDP